MEVDGATVRRGGVKEMAAVMMVDGETRGGVDEARQLELLGISRIAGVTRRMSQQRGRAKD